LTNEDLIADDSRVMRQIVTSECTPEMMQGAEAASSLFFIVKPFSAERFDEVFAPILG
jgi:two-component system chemotaxis response regulator CheY